MWLLSRHLDLKELSTVKIEFKLIQIPVYEILLYFVSLYDSRNLYPNVCVPENILNDLRVSFLLSAYIQNCVDYDKLAILCHFNTPRLLLQNNKATRSQSIWISRNTILSEIKISQSHVEIGNISKYRLLPICQRYSPWVIFFQAELWQNETTSAWSVAEFYLRLGHFQCTTHHSRNFSGTRSLNRIQEAFRRARRNHSNT